MGHYAEFSKAAKGATSLILLNVSDALLHGQAKQILTECFRKHSLPEIRNSSETFSVQFCNMDFFFFFSL